MKPIHLINLQKFAKKNNISSFLGAIDAILAILDEQIDATNETRISLGGYSVTLLPSADMKMVEFFLEHMV